MSKGEFITTVEEAEEAYKQRIRDCIYAETDWRGLPNAGSTDAW